MAVTDPPFQLDLPKGEELSQGRMEFRLSEL